MTKLKDIISLLELAAPRSLQESYDNSGLQVGFPDAEIGKVQVCLDVTEEIVAEAAEKGCSLIVSHHPLIFKALKTVSDATYQQRCVVKALTGGIAIYSAHTSLDNAPGGVNYKIASIIGLDNLSFLSPLEGREGGSGVIGSLPEPMNDGDFVRMLAERFGVKCVRHSRLVGKTVSKVAICGGAGAFLAADARNAGADCFVSGEFHYHDFFEYPGLTLVELGHYQSEKFTVDLLADLLKSAFPALEVLKTEIDTNPIEYSI